MRRSFKSIGLTLCVAGLVYGTLEGFSYGVFYAMYREEFSFGAVQKQLNAQAHVQENASPDGDTTRTFTGSKNQYVVHPYTGWVRGPGLQIRDYPNVGEADYVLTPFGFLAEEDPIEASNDEGVVIVGITGASVAERLFRNHEARDILRRAIAQRPEYQGKKIIFAALCTDSFKQPQQLMAVSYYLAQHGRLDLLIDIDGKNEATGFYVDYNHGVYPAYPSLWDGFFPGFYGGDTITALGNITMWRNVRYYTAAAFSRVDFSVTALTFWTLLDRYIETRAFENESAVSNADDTGAPYFITGPGLYRNAPLEALARFQLQLWEDGARQLQRLADGNHFAFFQFLQPTPYRHKPLSDVEKAQIYDSNSIHALTVNMFYAQMEAAVPELQAEGVNVYDFSGMFEHTSSTVYQDSCCHLNPAGESMLAYSIAWRIAHYGAAGQP